MKEDLRPAAGAPTLEDVARAAGVSRASVSRVINGVRNVDPAIQESVRRAVADTGYAPNRAARSLVTGRADVIALVVSGAVNGPVAEDAGGCTALGAGRASGGAGAGVPRPGAPRDADGTRDSPYPQVESAAPAEGAARAGNQGADGGSGSFTAQVFSDPFFGRVITGVVNYLRPRGMYPVLMFAETSAARDEVVAYLRQGSADGALVVSTDARDPLPALITEAGLPAVLYARPDEPARISYVDLDQRDGARLAAERLLSRGCRRIATIAGPLHLPVSRDRLAGFREALARRGVADVPCVEGRFTQRSGETAMRELLAGHPDLDGVFAGNDLMGVGACHVLREHGRRIPEDVAVVGFDDSGAATACRPPLTTVRQPVEDMAAEMGRLLLDRLAQPGRPVTSVIFEPSLVLRDSA